MRFAVHSTLAAEGDIEAAVEYLLAQGAEEAATELWLAFEDAFASLRDFPLRGHVPPELERHPDKRVRKIHAGVYCLIYRIIEKEVHILFVADGRRDIQDVLLERALRFGA